MGNGISRLRGRRIQPTQTQGHADLYHCIILKEAMQGFDKLQSDTLAATGSTENTVSTAAAILASRESGAEVSVSSVQYREFLIFVLEH